MDWRRISAWCLVLGALLSRQYLVRKARTRHQAPSTKHSHRERHGHHWHVEEAVGARMFAEAAEDAERRQEGRQEPEDGG